MATQTYQVLIPGIYKDYLIWIKGLYRCNEVKDFEMRLPWIIQEGSKCHHKCPYKREAKGGSTYAQTRKQCEDRQSLERYSYKPRNADSCQTLGEARNQFSPRVFGGNTALLTMISDFWPPGLWENIFLLFRSLVCGD